MGSHQQPRQNLEGWGVGRETKGFNVNVITILSIGDASNLGSLFLGHDCPKMSHSAGQAKLNGGWHGDCFQKHSSLKWFNEFAAA